jgi:hypothetical protein
MPSSVHASTPLTLSPHLDSFGFACYNSYQEAENCIRGFYSLGYDVSFARVNEKPSSKKDKAATSHTHQESFNARLKALSDPTSTNLYVSNLPRSMTEAVSLS